MPLAVWSWNPNKGKVYCDRCNEEKLDTCTVEKIPQREREPITLCFNCFWKVFPFGVVACGPDSCYTCNRTMKDGTCEWCKESRREFERFHLFRDVEAPNE